MKEYAYEKKGILRINEMKILESFNSKVKRFRTINVKRYQKYIYLHLLANFNFNANTEEKCDVQAFLKMTIIIKLFEMEQFFHHMFFSICDGYHLCNTFLILHCEFLLQMTS